MSPFPSISAIVNLTFVDTDVYLLLDHVHNNSCKQLMPSVYLSLQPTMLIYNWITSSALFKLSVMNMLINVGLMCREDG